MLKDLHFTHSEETHNYEVLEELDQLGDNTKI